MPFQKGHPYYRPGSKQEKEAKKKKPEMTSAILKAQMAKAGEGDTKAFSALIDYFKNLSKIETESKQKFDPDAALKAIDEAIDERNRIIKETPMTHVVNVTKE